ncbi:glycosyl hydrolase family 65 protein [Streptomyces antimycoticus]
MRDHGDILHFALKLPEQLSRLAFSLRFRQGCLRIGITGLHITYALAEGEPFQASHCGEVITLSKEAPQTRPVEPPSALPDPPNHRADNPHHATEPPQATPAVHPTGHPA